jgi:hypothetical protein
MYTDPGSGALLWQLVVSAFLGLAFYVSRLGNWIGRIFQRPGPAMPIQKPHT